MNARPTGRPVLWRIRMRRALRRFGCHRNAMYRPLDRTQTIIGFGLFLLFVVLGPIVAAGAVQLVYDAGVEAERHESATRHQVDAIVVRHEAPRAGVPGHIMGSRDQVGWRAADGSWKTGIVDTGKRVGEHVPLWVDNDGTVSRPPQNHTQTLGTAGFAAAGGLVAAAVPLALGYALIRRRFDRRRLAEWDDEWALISAYWTGRS
jgi:ABC-type Fe3+ transport system permease subunit